MRGGKENMNEIAKILDLEKFKIIKIEEKDEVKKKKKIIYLLFILMELWQ